MEGFTGIEDIGAFYKAIDPSLGKTILLIQTWIWWDLKDTFELHLMDLQAERVAALTQTEMSTDLQTFYRNEMNQPSAELTIKAIIDFEVKRTRELGQRFERRRETAPGYRIIIKRDWEGDAEFSQIIQTISQRLRVIDKLTANGDLEGPQREFYAKLLDCPTDDVTAERIVSYEQDTVRSLLPKLHSQLETTKPLGKPYDFKKKQIELVRKKIARVEELAASV